MIVNICKGEAVSFLVIHLTERGNQDGIVLVKLSSRNHQDFHFANYVNFLGLIGNTATVVNIVLLMHSTT